VRHARVGTFAPASDALVSADLHIRPRTPAAIDDKGFELSDFHGMFLKKRESLFELSIQYQEHRAPFQLRNTLKTG
jgi:hypothetical protein